MCDLFPLDSRMKLNIFNTGNKSEALKQFEEDIT